MKMTVKAAMHCVLIGPSGSGKSIVARRLAERLSVKHLDTDDQIERSQNKTIQEIFETTGEPAFRNMETLVINEALENNERTIIATGGGLPIIHGMMQHLNNSAATIYLMASVDALWDRITIEPGGLKKRPLLHRKGRSELEKMVSDREPIYKTANHIIQTDDMSPADIVDQLVVILERIHK